MPFRTPVIVSAALCLLLAAPLFQGFQRARAEDRFDRRAMLESIVDQVVVPGQAAFEAAAADLAAAAQTFVDEPSADNLARLQASWREAADAWAEIAVLALDLRLTAMHNQISKRPPNPDFLDEILAGDAELSEAFVNGSGSTSRGLPAIEYLIFSNEATDAEVLRQLDAPRRRQFLLALAQNIARKAGEVRAYWSPEGRDYAARFSKADQAGSQLQGSINMLVNKIYELLATDLEMWLGDPAGIATDGVARPELAEAGRSGHSLSLLASRLVGLRKIFHGGVEAEAIGFDDYLDFLGAELDGEPLSAVIDARFHAVLEAIEAIDLQLAEAVVEAPEAVAAFYEALRQLHIPLRADMKSHLSILVTFSDRDGDQ